MQRDPNEEFKPFFHRQPTPKQGKLKQTSRIVQGECRSFQFIVTAESWRRRRLLADLAPGKAVNRNIKLFGQCTEQTPEINASMGWKRLIMVFKCLSYWFGAFAL
ncbi:hypothetical protein [Hydrogenispora ethanolica]|uniref:hypothetical protein n=1 Tax=Hydrogenispora ethanolica TaxID=1082276 RepID=UPI0010465AE9|nr:hypothetical protein [Hydrogenispora ethanolica]